VSDFFPVDKTGASIRLLALVRAVRFAFVPKKTQKSKQAPVTFFFERKDPVTFITNNSNAISKGGGSGAPCSVCTASLCPYPLALQKQSTKRTDPTQAIPIIT